MEIMFIPNGVI